MNTGTAHKHKPLRNIRYFECADRPGSGSAFPAYTGDIYKLPPQAIALGQRLGMKCEELQLSIGAADHLYLCFSPALPAGSLELSEYATEPWHRFVLYGLSSSFNDQTLQLKMQEIMQANFAALLLLMPSSSESLQSLHQKVEAEGESLRILIKEKTSKSFHVRVEQVVPVHPDPAGIFVRVTNLQTQVSKETRVAEVRFYDDAPSLVDRIAIIGDTLTIHPRKSFRACLITDRYTVPVQVNLKALGVI